MTRKTLLPAIALLCGALACGAENRGSVALTNLCFPPDPQAGKACAYSSTCDTVLASGRLTVDVAISPSHTLVYPIEIRNFRPDNTSTFVGNSNTALVESFDIKYDGAGSVTSGTSVASLTVPSNGATVGVIEIIPPDAGAAMAMSFPAGETRIVASLRARGHYEDGASFTTAWFQVPVSVFNGTMGLYTCPAGKTLAGPCPQQGQTATASCE